MNFLCIKLIFLIILYLPLSEKLYKTGKVIYRHKNFVLVNLGRFDNIKYRQILNVVRHSQVIGTLRVRTVETLCSHCKIIEELPEISIKPEDKVVAYKLKKLRFNDKLRTYFGKVRKKKIRGNIISFLDRYHAYIFKKTYTKIKKKIKGIELDKIEKALDDEFILVPENDLTFKSFVMLYKTFPKFSLFPVNFYINDFTTSSILKFYSGNSIDRWIDRVKAYFKKKNEIIKAEKERFLKKIELARIKESLKALPIKANYIKELGKPDEHNIRFISEKIKVEELSWLKYKLKAQFLNGRFIGASYWK